MDAQAVVDGVAARVGIAGPRLAGQVLGLIVLWLLWRIVVSAVAGNVFTTANARRVLLVGLAAAVGGTCLQVLTFVAYRAIVARSAAGIVEASFSFSILPVTGGLIVLVLAWVFQRGVRLQRSVRDESTVSAATLAVK